MIKFYFYCLALLLMSTVSLMGKESGHNHLHHHHGHNYELGLSLGYTHLTEDKINAPSSHLHLTRRLGSENAIQRFSLGLGAEYIFAEETHITFLGSFSYNPVAAFIIDLSPGLLIAEHEGETEYQYISHLEFTYEFDMHSFGIGPVFGVAFSSDDRHYSVGIHIGKGL